MRCIRCGKGFRPSGRGSRQKYCSTRCRQLAWRERQQAKAKKPDTSTKPAATKPVKPDKVQKAAKDLKALSEGEFNSMMTGGTDEALQLVAHVLSTALTDDDTPANALTPIAKEYLTVVKEMDERIKHNNGIMDASPTVAENTPVNLGDI